MSNPFAHIELNTDDVAKAKKFYRSVFDWKLNDMPGMGYTLIEVGKGGTGGGMQKKPMAGAPTSWLPYVQVDSVKTSVAKATKAGGRVIVGYQPIGDMGAIGIFADPAGAMLGVWEAAKKAPKKRASAAKRPAKKKTKATAKKKTRR